MRACQRAFLYARPVLGDKSCILFILTQTRLPAYIHTYMDRLLRVAAHLALASAVALIQALDALAAGAPRCVPGWNIFLYCASDLPAEQFFFY